MGRSLGFGSRACDCAPHFRLAFASASSGDLTLPHTANSPAHSSKGTPSLALVTQRGLRQLVGSRFQVLFHSPPGVLFTFPSRYWFTIGRQGVLSLRGWSPQIHAGFHGSRATREHCRRSVAFRLQGCYLLWRPVPWPSSTCRLCNSASTPVHAHAGPTTPTRQRHRAITPGRFRLIPVRSPLLGESRLLSLPRPTEMFHFGRFPPQALWIQTWVTGHDPGRVSPFGHLRIKPSRRLPEAFRSQTRPSSAPGAKASTVSP